MVDYTIAEFSERTVDGWYVMSCPYAETKGYASPFLYIQATENQLLSL